MRASARAPVSFDPTIYPVDEKMGENLLQRRITELLRPLVERWLGQRGERALVGADQFVYYRQHAPTKRVAPDVYVLPGVHPNAGVTSVKTWERGIVPSFALEVVSDDWEKDYVEVPARYRTMGVPELIIFDPAPERRPEGFAWQVYRRVRGRPLVRVEVSRGDRVRSRTLSCHLRAVGKGELLRLRLGTGSRGDELFPTAEEAERAAKEAALAAREAALTDRDAALRLVADLEARLRRRPSRSRQ